MASFDTLKLLAMDAFEYDPELVVVEHYEMFADGTHRAGVAIALPPQAGQAFGDALFVDYYHTVGCARTQIYKFAEAIERAKQHHGGTS